MESLAAAKYITKYTHKGPDRATMEIHRRDEVSQFRDSRYISAAEAARRLLEFPIHHQEPNVVRLQLHLPGQHFVVFDPSEHAQSVLQRAQSEVFMLTGFFSANHTLSNAPRYAYQEFPQHFVWKTKEKVWAPRKTGRAIGRIYFVHPAAGERFYLRILTLGGG